MYSVTGARLTPLLLLALAALLAVAVAEARPLGAPPLQRTPQIPQSAPTQQLVEPPASVPEAPAMPSLVVPASGAGPGVLTPPAAPAIAPAKAGESTSTTSGTPATQSGPVVAPSGGSSPPAGPRIAPSRWSEAPDDNPQLLQPRSTNPKRPLPGGSN